MPAVQVTDSKTDTAGYAHLTLARPGGLTYLPGQYVTIAHDATEKPKFLALASHPAENTLLFVSRNAPTPVGSKVILSEPMGKGFTCDFAEDKPFLYLTHGTGISAIRPAMLERVQRGFTHDTLLYGIRDAAQTPELDCLAPSFGVQQLRAYSAAKHWHVQHALADIDLSAFGTIILVGSKEMMEACRKVLADKNFASARVFSNY